jgi:acyl-coenzyme A synthetase/AMP-(fatty) acid ligase
MGEALLVLVVLREGIDLTANDLIKFGRECLGPIKAPRGIELVRSIPKSKLGKLARAKIHAEYAKSAGVQ